MNISNLPTELLLQILKEAARNPGWDEATHSPAGRRVLSAVCFRWRDIVLNTAEIWSLVRVHLEKTRYSGKESTFEKALAALELDLSRTRSQLLDVYWNSRLDLAHAKRVFQVVMERAPFCRWRSLEIYNDSWDSYSLHAIRSEERFYNLESLRVRWCQVNGFLPLINRTVSSNFRFFYDKDSILATKLYESDMNNIISRTTELTLPDFGHNPIPPLPPHNTRLSVCSVNLREASHVQHLKVRSPLSISQFVDHKWSSLVSLDVWFTKPRSSRPLQQQLVLLPRLQTLIVSGGYFEPILNISTPPLDRLRLERGHENVKGANSSLSNTLSHPSFSLISTKKLEISFPLLPAVLTTVIIHFSSIGSLGLGLDNSYDGWELVRHVICEKRYLGEAGGAGGTTSVAGLEDIFLAQIETLELQMSWNNGGIALKDTWKAYMARIFDDTRGKQLAMIRCSWPNGAIRQLTRSDLEESRMKDETDGMKQEEEEASAL
ncbi:hypothetical protein FRC20_010257 [Serendipita sp. 405]|nr:hypothetical protein FRC20_010257 [Serendipita sp. 405]